MNLLATLFVIFSYYYLKKVETNWFTSYIGCPESSSSNLGDCLGASSVYRMSLALIILYSILIIISLLSCSIEFSKVWNEGKHRHFIKIN